MHDEAAVLVPPLMPAAPLLQAAAAAHVAAAVPPLPAPLQAAAAAHNAAAVVPLKECCVCMDDVAADALLIIFRSLRPPLHLRRLQRRAAGATAGGARVPKVPRAGAGRVARV
jgi:hypothetical protein